MFLHYFYYVILPFLYSPKVFSFPFVSSISHSSYLAFFHPLMSSRQLFPHYNFFLYCSPFSALFSFFSFFLFSLSVILFFVICCFSSSPPPCCHTSFHFCFVQRVVKSCLYPDDKFALRRIMYARF